MFCLNVTASVPKTVYKGLFFVEKHHHSKESCTMKKLGNRNINGEYMWEGVLDTNQDHFM